MFRLCLDSSRLLGNLIKLISSICSEIWNVYMIENISGLQFMCSKRTNEERWLGAYKENSEDIFSKATLLTGFPFRYLHAVQQKAGLCTYRNLQIDAYVLENIYKRLIFNFWMLL